MLHKVIRRVVLIKVFCLLLINSCNTIEELNLFTLADDVELGRQIKEEIQNNSAEYPVYTGDPAVKTYIKQVVFDHLLASPDVENENIFPYQIEIIDRRDVLNAFALPGGYIYIYTGLLLYLDSEAALAGVIGHEIAHAEKRHATRRLTAYYGTVFLLNILLGEDPSEIEEIAANLFVGLAFLANSRADENESDEYSFKYLDGSRYYPGGVKFFFEKLRFEGLIDTSSAIETFLSTHPDPIERIQNTNQRLIDNGYEVKTFQSNDDDIYRDEYFINIRDKL